MNMTTLAEEYNQACYAERWINTIDKELNDDIVVVLLDYFTPFDLMDWLIYYQNKENKKMELLVDAAIDKYFNKVVTE